MTGQTTPSFFSQAIPNVNGIVKYEVSRAVDHDGGRSLNISGNWSNVDDFQVSSSSLYSILNSRVTTAASIVIGICMCYHDACL